MALPCLSVDRTLEYDSRYPMENPTIVFERPRVVKIDRAELPRPKRGEILVETIVSLISTGTELTILSGEFPEQSVWARYGKFPFVAGYSNIGRVAQAGDDVVPDNVRDEEAAFFAIAGIVMNSIRRAELKWGEIVVVFGLGILGQL